MAVRGVRGIPVSGKFAVASNLTQCCSGFVSRKSVKLSDLKLLQKPLNSRAPSIQKKTLGS